MPTLCQPLCALSHPTLKTTMGTGICVPILQTKKLELRSFESLDQDHSINTWLSQDLKLGMSDSKCFLFTPRYQHPHITKGELGANWLATRIETRFTETHPGLSPGMDCSCCQKRMELNNNLLHVGIFLAFPTLPRPRHAQAWHLSVLP